ncbi:ribonuclease domain-containing protein [Advenella mimigardefordensis]|nr:ribonuclease domain-containing protein [Advenella mimigardefordensis]
MQRLLSTFILAMCAPAYAMGWAAPTPAPSKSSTALAGGIDRCEVVLDTFNKTALDGQVDPGQLSDIVRSLNARQQLPAYFVTKKQARQAGWSPGQYFADIPALRGKSIGGDHFGNYERRLPQGQWKEADLDYRGKKRNAKRLIFAQAGQQYVTVDHYETFHKVPACR